MAVSQTRKDQIRDLVNQWEQIVGYSISVPDFAVDDLVNAAAFTLYDVGQYMNAKVGGPGAPSWQFVPDWYGTMPWAKYGMSKTEYDAKYTAFQSSWLQLTGQSYLPVDLPDRALGESQGNMTGAQFSTWLLSQQSVKNTYGWLKYGLDYEQFQTQKLQMRSSFGHDLTDADAVTQLQYLHQAQGPDMSARVVPTFTQAEKKNVNVGPAQSVIR